MSIRGVCLDIAGVLTDNGRCLPGAREALADLDAAGLPWRLLTNTSRRPPADLLTELHALDLPVPADRLYAAPQVVADVVRARDLSPFLIVHPAIRHLFSAPTREPDAVVLCDAGDGFDYRTLDAAFALLQRGAPLLAVGRNRHFQGRERLELDAGPFVRALEDAAGITAEIIGKPGRAMFIAACASMGVDPAQAAMIGDDRAADVDGAEAAGLQGWLVRTGKYRAGDEQGMETRCAADVHEAVRRLLAG